MNGPQEGPGDRVGAWVGGGLECKLGENGDLGSLEGRVT